MTAVNEANETVLFHFASDLLINVQGMSVTTIEIIAAAMVKGTCTKSNATTVHCKTHIAGWIFLP